MPSKENSPSFSPLRPEQNLGVFSPTKKTLLEILELLPRSAHCLIGGVVTVIPVRSASVWVVAFADSHQAPGAEGVSLEPVGSEGVLHSRVSEHQVAIQHVQSQGVHPERVVQGEGVHLKAGDVRQGAGDLFGQTRR